MPDTTLQIVTTTWFGEKGGRGGKGEYFGLGFRAVFWAINLIATCAVSVAHYTAVYAVWHILHISILHSSIRCTGIQNSMQCMAVLDIANHIAAHPMSALHVWMTIGGKLATFSMSVQALRIYENGKLYVSTVQHIAGKGTLAAPCIRTAQRIATAYDRRKKATR
eukprot:1657581-Rhodomonas_salina.2